MCTVTYIPTDNGFVFTSNRDEQKSRANTLFPEQLTFKDEHVFFPKDPLGKGSWIAFSKSRLVCLLNGGFSKHKRTLPYRKSRGLIVLDRFNYDLFSDFSKDINLENIEPFTLISVENFLNKKTIIVSQLLWDGVKKHFCKKDEKQSFIWSSTTLYTHEMIKKRKNIFYNVNPLNSKEALSFHTKEGDELGIENSFKMKRKTKLETISTTQIEKVKSQLNINYFNYITNKKSKLAINLL